MPLHTHLRFGPAKVKRNDLELCASHVLIGHSGLWVVFVLCIYISTATK